ncbi:CDC14-domain-containing protein [Rickenella mellea]|uniref:CDC14-domain-containing protein n=1 Tax=Rickenella mellea TaxID=50990 RepID=A0A4R5XER2_9AGAM|nr:CDC14-domain-containing protein [Rickenella mellea]
MCMLKDIQDRLDSICSSKSSFATRDKELSALEGLIATLILPGDVDNHGRLREFICSQDCFQCNIPSRLIGWLSSQIPLLNKLNEGNNNLADNDDPHILVAQTVSSLSLIQGVALIHPPSKTFLASAFSIQIILDLLLISRQLSTKPFSNITNTTHGQGDFTAQREPPLATAVLDTLLCILVDSPPATRVLEQLNGVEVVVKVLKKAGIPRDIRMKCLEFLYFYLMDEASESTVTEVSSTKQSSPTLTAVHTRPSSPTKCDLSLRTPLKHSEDTALAPAHSSESVGTSFSLSPTPTLSAPPPSPTRSEPKPRSLALLRKDVDFVPMSPKKRQPLVGHGDIRVTPIKLPDHGPGANKGKTANSFCLDRSPSCPEDESGCFIRSTAEKREILGHLLGNVDALVDGVKKAGVWGLG